MAKRRLVLTAGVLTVYGLLSAALSEVIPKPTDTFVFYMIDWLGLYGSQIDTWFAKFVEVWSFYFFACIWYVFLAVLVLQFELKLTKTVMMILAISVIFWLAKGPSFISMDFGTGIKIIQLSVVIFAVLLVLLVHSLREEYDILNVE